MAAERPQGGEGQPKPKPIELAVKATEEVLEETKKGDGPFEKLIASYEKRLIGDGGEALDKEKRQKIHDSAKGMVMAGAGAAFGKISFFSHFAHDERSTREEVRSKILESSKKDPPEGLDLYVENNPNSSGGRSNILNHFKSEQLAMFDQKIKEAKKEERDGLEIQKQAFSQGWDAVVSLFNKNLASPPMAKAA